LTHQIDFVYLHYKPEIIMKFGIIGMGNIGRVHADNILNGAVEGAELTALANQPIESLAPFQEQGIACFADANELIDSGRCEAVIIALPTALHAPIGIRALRAGLHIIMEKPLALHKAEAQRLLAARQSDDQLIALMMNQRTHPVYARIKQWIDEGRVGPLQRISWTMTNWFRPEIYYQSSSWRATWKGEGGGVLMNQCPHNLDILQWLVGMPIELTASCAFGKYHDIEVEDEVFTTFRFKNGARGQFAASTGEAPGVNRLELVGNLGTVISDGTSATLYSASQPVSAFSRSTLEMFGMPEISETHFKPAETINQHAAILTNFVRTSRGHETLIAPAAEGMNSLELAGAMIYSAWLQQPVSLPLDADAYEKVLQEKISLSIPREVVTTAAAVDMSKSYR
jgi:predicted dehydrogenase